MALFSVPTDLHPSAQIGTEPEGVLLDGAGVDNVGTNPIQANPPSQSQIAITNASDLVDAVDDDAEDKFWTLEETLGENSVSTVVCYSGGPVADPGVDTDHFIDILIRVNGTADTTQLIIGMYSQSDEVNAVYFALDPFVIPAAFELIKIPLTIEQVQDFRSKNGYVAGTIFFLQIAGSVEEPNPFLASYDVAYISLEVPTSSPSDGIQASGGAGENPDFEDEIEGGMEFTNGDEEGDILLLENQFVETSGGVQDESQEQDTTTFINSVTGGIELEGDPNIVMSVDPSGIYTLIPGQRFDRLYTRNVDPDDTEDVAIPTPFVKTGFLGE